MRLSWNEIRVRAARFAREWVGEGYEKGQTQLFYRDFFDVFGVPVRRVASFEEPVKNWAKNAAISISSGRACCSLNKRAPVTT
ncbi:type IIL restriction-modification enzyme MmeI [Bradyrhizobium sp. BWC-3-1]|uniref:type IIL restriction-modification enzyme MmeI n=1 Tax=Bradyrhizobium sp. BWC-3-1 TaxID=3080012 RepID=UPI00293F7197|nr:type IIL restriction-modification enzyme MmeI [Bradyrhizobium sp. BWC-3-1]WOH59467.1 type IIL restriction-modification enzyme MmeI [Bradyrhizobium sp. BWC-3-1]